jgi:poly(A) polymerase
VSNNSLLSRQFALDVVATLRAAGHQALWAGGCVRDQLLGMTPKDYDVATDAEPERIRAVFGRKRTLPIGAAFGVITVLGPKDAGQIEVATFRRDLGYSDGRRPDAVAFTSAEEDAQRRDFTINGIFYDPIAEQYHDYVGGQGDLQRRLIRAIGSPHERFAEDKLRMLRAVRIAATLDFALDPATLEAIKDHASQISVVSGERIAAEMRRILVHPRRVAAVQMLHDSTLLEFILPESTFQKDNEWNATISLLRLLNTPTFPLAMAALIWRMPSDAARQQVPESGENLAPDKWPAVGDGSPDPRAMISAVSNRWKLSNEERDDITKFLTQSHQIRSGGLRRERTWSFVQPLLITRGAAELLDFTEALETLQGNPIDYVSKYREMLKLPREQLDPPPLLTGEDLKTTMGLVPGPTFARLLKYVRDAQLNEIVKSKEEALQYARQWVPRTAENIRGAENK